MCVHHWILDSEDNGKCEKCGKERHFASEVKKSLGLANPKSDNHVEDVVNVEYYMQGAFPRGH